MTWLKFYQYLILILGLPMVILGIVEHDWRRILVNSVLIIFAFVVVYQVKKIKQEEKINEQSKKV